MFCLFNEDNLMDFLISLSPFCCSQFSKTENLISALQDTSVWKLKTEMSTHLWPPIFVFLEFLIEIWWISFLFVNIWWRYISLIKYLFVFFSLSHSLSLSLWFCPSLSFSYSVSNSSNFFFFSLRFFLSFFCLFFWWMKWNETNEWNLMECCALIMKIMEWNGSFPLIDSHVFHEQRRREELNSYQVRSISSPLITNSLI